MKFNTKCNRKKWLVLNFAITFYALYSLWLSKPICQSCVSFYSSAVKRINWGNLPLLSQKLVCFCFFFFQSNRPQHNCWAWSSSGIYAGSSSSYISKVDRKKKGNFSTNNVWGSLQTRMETPSKSFIFPMRSDSLQRKRQPKNIELILYFSFIKCFLLVLPQYFLVLRSCFWLQ